VLLTVAGDQVPVMPSKEVVGNTGAVPPLQIAGSALKAGVTFGVTTCVKVAVVAHCPAVGVNVYVPVAVLLTVAGDQVPVIPSVEVAGSIGAVPPLQSAPGAAKVGVVVGLIV
jgi:hypothetical protein